MDNEDWVDKLLEPFEEKEEPEGPASPEEILIEETMKRLRKGSFKRKENQDELRKRAS